MDHSITATQSISLEGEVVELVTEGGRQRVRVMLAPEAILSLVEAGGSDVHLGDRIVITGSIRIERVQPAT